MFSDIILSSFKSPCWQVKLFFKQSHLTSIFPYVYDKHFTIKIFKTFDSSEGSKN